MKHALPICLVFLILSDSQVPAANTRIARGDRTVSHDTEPESEFIEVLDPETEFSTHCVTSTAARLHRAGNPRAVAPWARCTYGGKYRGYYVGGGVTPRQCVFYGEGRCLDEGTWGVDYAPNHSRVQLLWSHGRLYQGGTGQYEPNHKNRPFGQLFGPWHQRH